MSSRAENGARSAFNYAVGKIKSGDYLGADKFLANALTNFPNDPNLLRLLGLSLCKQSRFEEAEKHLIHAIRLVPDFAAAHESLAEALMMQGKLEQAVRALKTTIKHDSSNTSAHRKLAELLSLIGRGLEADEIFQRTLDKNPNRAAIVEAMELNREGQSDKAERIYRSLLRDNPDDVDALRLLGVICVKKDQYNDAEAFFTRAVELSPDYWMAWINLGTALNEQQKFSQADEAYKKALAIKPKSVHTLEKLGANCMNEGRLEDAVSWLNKALALDNTHFPSLLCLGHALKTIGRQQEAIDAYRACAKSKPDFGEVYWSLANLKTFRFEPQEVDAMKQKLKKVAETGAQEDSEISFSFALAKAAEDRGDYQEAFDYYFQGNQKKRVKVNHDPSELQRIDDRILDVFTREFFASRNGQGCIDDSPILIVGLPRSGSTLLEQILASHSQVEGTAELHHLLRIARESGANRLDGIKYPECMHELQPHQIKGLGEEYIESTMAHRTGSQYFTDKMPNNFIGIGFLHTVLPNAKVIDARRHPLDSCLGSFKQLFARGQVFTYDLYDLAHYYIEYIRVMDHWNQTLPGKVLTVNYEDVVTDLEGQAKRIAQHCGLDWEDQMLRFHETERAVKTASSEQVRQPIYKGSVNLWRNYESQLEELIDYLEPVLMKLPEDQKPGILQTR
ncbi:MAG: sulfotransferase [Pseudomonadota bacterium]